MNKNSYFKVRQEIIKTIDEYYNKLLLKKTDYKKIFSLFLKKLNSKVYFESKYFSQIKYFKSIDEYKNTKKLNHF